MKMYLTHLWWKRVFYVSLSHFLVGYTQCTCPNEFPNYSWKLHCWLWHRKTYLDSHQFPQGSAGLVLRMSNRWTYQFVLDKNWLRLMLTVFLLTEWLLMMIEISWGRIWLLSLKADRGLFWCYQVPKKLEFGSLFINTAIFYFSKNAKMPSVTVPFCVTAQSRAWL